MPTYHLLLVLVQIHQIGGSWHFWLEDGEGWLREFLEGNQQWTCWLLLLGGGFVVLELLFQVEVLPEGTLHLSRSKGL